MKIMLKTMLAVLLAISLSFPALMNTAKADDGGYGEWIEFCYAVAVPGPKKHHVEEFRPWLINHNFPTRVLRNVTYECRSWNGNPINGLAIDLSGGVNLRSTPNYSNNRNIVMKVHGDVTVYIYFEFYNQYGSHWYYGVTESGVEGYMAAVRLQLVTLD